MNDEKPLSKINIKYNIETSKLTDGFLYDGNTGATLSTNQSGLLNLFFHNVSFLLPLKALVNFWFSVFREIKGDLWE